VRIERFNSQPAAAGGLDRGLEHGGTRSIAVSGGGRGTDHCRAGQRHETSQLSNKDEGFHQMNETA
jgi:hypothetical protein